MQKLLYCIHSILLVSVCIHTHKSIGYTHAASSASYPHFGPGAYHSISSLHERLEAIALDISKFDGYIHVHKLTKNSAELSTYLVRLRGSGSGTKQGRALLVFGMHPRELVGVESALFFIDEIVSIVSEHLHTPCSSVRVRRYLQIMENFEYIDIIPLLNVDGRAAMEKNTDWCRRSNINHVDLNRNFAWMFAGPGSSGKKGHEEYRGSHAFSETEAKLIQKLVHENYYTVLLDVHSGEQQILSSYVDSEAKLRSSFKANEARELAVIDDVLLRGYLRGGGVAHKINSYDADGTLLDWASSEGIDYVFVVESFGKTIDDNEALPDCFNQFNPDVRELSSILSSINMVYWTTLMKISELENEAQFELLERYPQHAAAAERINLFYQVCCALHDRKFRDENYSIKK